VLAVIGPTTNAACTAVAEAYSKDSAERLPWLPVSAVPDDDIPAVTYPGYVPARPDDSQLTVPMLSTLAADAAARRVAIVRDPAGGDPASDWARGLRSALTGGGKTVLDYKLPADPAALAPALITDGAEAVAFAGLLPQGLPFARALHDLHFTGQRVAPEPLLDPGFLEGGEAAEGWVLSATFIDPTAHTPARAFTAAYRAAHGGEDPVRHAAEAYDAAAFIAHTATALGPDRLTRPALLSGLFTARYEGITKTFAYDQSTRALAGGTGLYRYRVSNGTFTFLGPTSIPS
jgi:ABC-type branched-subunit amino acid transport system substrate-binding protein